LFDTVEIFAELLAVTHFFFFETVKSYQAEDQAEEDNPDNNETDHCLDSHRDVHCKDPASNSSERHHNDIGSDVAFPGDIQLFDSINLGDCKLLGLIRFFTQPVQIEADVTGLPAYVVLMSFDG
jgi:hypothetical protein